MCELPQGCIVINADRYVFRKAIVIPCTVKKIQFYFLETAPVVQMAISLSLIIGHCLLSEYV